MQFALEVAILKYSLTKHSQRKLGVNKNTKYEVFISLEKKKLSLWESLDFHSCLGQTFLHYTSSYCQNLQNVLLYRHFGGCHLLVVGL
jgi:hypothetical protein